jgi:hypothetical protein
MFFDKLYNCVPIVKLPAEVEPKESQPPPEPRLDPGLPPLYSNAQA